MTNSKNSTSNIIINKKNNKNKLKKSRDDDSSDDSNFSDEYDSSIYETEDEPIEEEDDEYISEEDENKIKLINKNKSKKLNQKNSENTTESDNDSDMSPEKIRKEIAKIFPSKHMKKKIDADKKIKKLKKSQSLNKKVKSTKKLYNNESDNDSTESDENIEDDTKLRRSKRLRNKNNKSPKKKHKKDDNDDDENSDSETLYDTEDDSDEEFNEENDDNYINLVFNISGNGEEDFFNENEEDIMNEEDDEYCSEQEKSFMKESYREFELPEQIKKEEEKEKEKKNKKRKKKNTEFKKKDDSEDPELKDIENEYIELIELRKDFIEKLNNKPNNKILLNSLKECNESINKLIKEARIKNTKDYHKLVNATNKTINEIQYIKNKLSNKEQMKIMKDLKEVNSYIKIQKPYVLSLLESKIPPNYKAIAMQKLNLLKKMQAGDSEYYKIKQWVDGFMKIPFGIYKNFNVTIDDGVDKCNDFLEKSKKILDECTYGLEEAKMQIMQMVGQWITNPQSVGTAIAINGPMGTGKTSLIKDGVSKIFGRDFAFIGLGGATYSSFLDGHSYTYEGSSWGKIAQILMESKCMNPIIYFDELDKVSDTPQGQEIIGLLTHMTDTAQNTEFRDKYFNEFGLDLSKCLFIFSYNDESLVNPILRDRMYKIRTNGYDTKDKIIIAQNYLLPKIRDQVKFNKEDIIITEDTLKYIIDSPNLTKGEQGVRNLKRCLEIIYTKLNLFRLINPSNKMLENQIKLDVQFPFTVTRKNVEILIKNEENQKQSVFSSLYI